MYVKSPQVKELTDLIYIMYNTYIMNDNNLEKTVRATLRRIISSNEFAFRNSAESQRRYRDTDKGKAAVKRQNTKVAEKGRRFISLAAKLQQVLENY